MAVGTVLFSIPMAFTLALYGYAVESISASQSLLIYSAMGTAILVTFTLLHGLKFSDLR
jgi:hypothetical protein